MLRFKRRTDNGQRRGTTIVETAVVAPVFAVFLAAIMEFGHAFLVVGTLNAAAKQAARHGAVEGITSADVINKANGILGAALDISETTVLVKDASIFDSPSLPETIDYDELPNIELNTADRRQLYVVRISVAYNDVALMPPFWAKDLELVGQSVMRHE
jgi:hypothetical protein